MYSYTFQNEFYMDSRETTAGAQLQEKLQSGQVRETLGPK